VRFDVRYSAVLCFINPEPRNSRRCESKRYLLPEECPFLKQKKTILPSPMKQDGFFNALIELKTLD
jgi:hypothetical protein